MQDIERLKQRIREEQTGKKIVVSFAGDCTIGTDDRFLYENSFPTGWPLRATTLAIFSGCFARA